MHISEAQERAWANKLAKNFDTTSEPAEVWRLIRELGELLDAVESHGDIAGEMADVAIYLLGLSEMLGVDLDAAVAQKLDINERRVYERQPDGTWSKYLPPAWGEPGARLARRGPGNLGRAPRS